MAERLEESGTEQPGPAGGPPEAVEQETVPIRRAKPVRKIALLAGMIVVCAGAAWAWQQGWLGGSSDGAEEAPSPKAIEEKPEQKNGSLVDDEEIEAGIVGRWELKEEGRYQLTLRPDSTGTLVYEPNWKNKVALAWTDRLEIAIRWSVKDGMVDMSSISGTPKRAFKIAINSRGKEKHYRVKDLSKKKLVLFEVTDRKTDNWHKLH